jgi:hypothetical protein
MERNNPLARMHGAGGPSYIRAVAMRIVTYQRHRLKPDARVSPACDIAMSVYVGHCRASAFVFARKSYELAGRRHARDPAGFSLANSAGTYEFARETPRPRACRRIDALVSLRGSARAERQALSGFAAGACQARE